MDVCRYKVEGAFNYFELPSTIFYYHSGFNIPVDKMTNFDSDRVIILYYAIGAGGKFLAHNLSLSPDCVMMNSKLAMMQLEGKLNQKQKVSILLESIKNTDSEWKDFGFNDIDWFGFG